MAEFLTTLVFILPGLMAYFWLQVFGLNPTVKHTAPELSGIAALLWLPVSFISLLVLNTWSAFIKIEILSVDQVWTVESLNKATSDIRYLVLFLLVSFLVSYFICWLWSLWGHEILRNRINEVRKTRKIGPLSSSSSVWEEFFIKINKELEDNEENDHDMKEAVLIVYKIDKPEEFIAGSMTKVSRPLEVDKGLVLEDIQQWIDSINNDYDYDVKRAYVDIKSGMVIKEINHKNPRAKTIPEHS
ncbi:hypothetical protein [Bacillus sp. V59.32b]|uniref:hypothetical protein n=1 Tax=Bacillus sp. V59.32b TaxID=1758642 RepID=UPI000E3D036A|nr:hypothetical protein [Bacillus sp. V59.32b]RFU60823.1 hypothetical protein D0463_16020 [Bacillus sp. V59.32b]